MRKLTTLNMPPDLRKTGWTSVVKFIAHSKRAVSIASQYGWLPGARYTNLRDVRGFDRLGFLDVDWKHYDFRLHLEAAKATRPLMTVARDVEKRVDLERTIEEARELAMHCTYVVIVPKDLSLAAGLELTIPQEFMLGYSVPTRYGGTHIPPSAFRRPVHLLGGRPDTQRRLAEKMRVVSVDCNRFTLDATFGDYFDGETFRPHPDGGYERCLEDSIRNIEALWYDYSLTQEQHLEQT